MPQISGSLDTPLPPSSPTLSQLILDRVARTPEAPALGSPNPDGTWRVRTWREAGQEMVTLAAGLLALGLKPEERVAIASNTRVEWVLADGAVMLAGGANTTIYPSTGEDDFAYIMNDSGSRYLVAEDQGQADKALSQLDQIPALDKIILIEGAGDGDRVLSWAELSQLGAQRLAENPKAVEETVAAIRPDSLATLIYTSGTTGRPKGVMLPQSNWVFQGREHGGARGRAPRRRAVPVASAGPLVRQGAAVRGVPGRVRDATSTAGCRRSWRTCRWSSRPSWRASRASSRRSTRAPTPRRRPAAGPRPRSSTGRSAPRPRSRPSSAPGSSPVRWPRRRLALADKLVFSKIQALTGGRMRVMISGSAALNGDVARWFDAAGLPIIEGYGLTENSAAACVVRPEDLVFGSVGQPLPGTQVMIAEDGEVLLRGPHVMKGYWNLPEVNAETLLPDGWLATGDIGELDDQGRLKITDRKKDLVKTSGGKYIAPGQIAAQFKVISALASNLVVHASDRNYATALISLDPEALEKFAADQGLIGDYATLSQSPEVHAALQADIDTLNGQLNRWETIKKFAVLPRDLSEEAGELTASLKVRRKAVEEHFNDLIEGMYAND